MVDLQDSDATTLAVRTNQDTVRLTADVSRLLGRPLMRTRFTRRLAVACWELASPQPDLPPDLGVRPTVDYRVLDPHRYVTETSREYIGGRGKLQLLRDLQTHALYIFKKDRGTILPLWSQGIDTVSQPLRATAAAAVAQLLGIDTPNIELVQFNGDCGSLQDVLPGCTNFSRLKYRHPRRYSQLINRDGFAQQRSDIWILDRIIGSLDRQSHNILVSVPVSGITGAQLIPVDQDLTFPPMRQYRPMSGVRAYTPSRVRRSTYSRLCTLVENPVELRNAIAPFLSDPEIQAALERAADTAAIVQATVNARGEGNTFFAEPKVVGAPQ